MAKKVIEIDHNKETYDYFEVTMNFTGRLCGSVPQNPEIVRDWITARAPKTTPENPVATIDEIVDEVNKSLEVQQEGMSEDEIQKMIEKTTLGFQADGDGNLVVRMGTIKAHLKDSANQVKEALGIPAFKSRVANNLYLLDYFNPIMKNGDNVTESDDSYEQPVHAFVRSKGVVEKINALKVIHYLVKPTITYRFSLQRNGLVPIGSLVKILEYGGQHGYGGERSLGEGRYTASIKKIPRPDDAPVVTLENDIFADLP